MTDFTKTCNTEQETLDWAAELASRLPRERFTVFLEGDLGAGKTTLVRGILKAMGCKSHIKSPTYTLVESYDLPGGVVHHFDLYRMEDPEELEYIGGREYFDQGLCFIEWPEKGRGWLPEPDLLLSITMQGNTRQITSHWQNIPA